MKKVFLLMLTSRLSGTGYKMPAGSKFIPPQALSAEDGGRTLKTRQLPDLFRRQLSILCKKTALNPL